MKTSLFVYGTLKRGCSNHAQLAGQSFVGAARTAPGFRLFNLGGYPALVAHPSDRDGVTGEVWSVDAECLQRLDVFEGVHEGLYRRAVISLQPPFAGDVVHVYLPGRPTAGLRDLGSNWVD